MCPGAACRGSGLCRVGVLPGGWGGCAGVGLRAGGGRRCARAKGVRRGWGLCRGGLAGGFSRAAAQKLFFKRPFAHVLGSARGGFCKIGG